jgi:hypothetical protein
VAPRAADLAAVNFPDNIGRTGMTQAAGTLPRRRGFGQTARRDAWWVTPAIVFTVFTTFIVYVTWAALQGDHYRFGPYLSPLYSPELFGDPEHAWFGGRPGAWPAWLPFSPALFILWAPGLFRFTCYYYRGAYYKAFWADPPSCAVGEPRKSYIGERSFPLILQNVHRYFMYLAVLFLVVLAYDVWLALWFTNPTTGATEFGIGVGTLVLAANTVLLGSYTLGCHSLRHIVGGRLTQLSKRPVQHKCYTACSALNRRHMLFAWLSLVWVGFSDVYVRLCSMGIWTDWRIL